MRRLRASTGAAFGLAAALSVVAGCATTPPRTPDPFCPAIRDFANTTPKSTTRSAELTTSWFAGDSLAVSAQCRHSSDDAASKALCGVLVQHGSREFAVGNVERVLACMSKSGRIEGLPVYAVESLSGEVHGWEMPGVDEDVVLTLSFTVGATADPPRLRIAARRSALAQ